MSAAVLQLVFLSESVGTLLRIRKYEVYVFGEH